MAGAIARANASRGTMMTERNGGNSTASQAGSSIGAIESGPSGAARVGAPTVGGTDARLPHPRSMQESTTTQRRIVEADNDARAKFRVSQGRAAPTRAMPDVVRRLGTHAAVATRTGTNDGRHALVGTR